MKTVQRLFPWLTSLLALAILANAAVNREYLDSDYDWESFGEIPVSASGRVKPVDTVARNTLMVISGKQSLTIDGKHLPAIQWYADVLANPEVAAGQKIFRVDHPDLLAVLGLAGPGDDARKLYSFDELALNLEELSRQGGLAFEAAPKDRSLYQREVINLYNRVSLYLQTRRAETPYMIPPLHEGEEWRPMAEALMDPAQIETEAVVAWRDIIGQYHAEDPEQFNMSVARYHDLIAPALGPELAKAKYEVLYNEFKPFYQSTILYVLAFLLASFSFLLSNLAKKDWSVALWRSMMWMLIITFILHTAGLGLRIILQGRPPVTNLYSSAVFIGWGCVGLGIFLERIFKMGLPGMASAVIGVGTLIVAHNLGNSGDTMEMMQAVLDSNFWLATHVIVVTIGYSAMFLAGFLAIAYILLGVFTNVLRGDPGKAMFKMIYGIICFAAVTSFVGTVLGGIWADQSWGRFWGWDPKENGAVMIVLMTLIILHARWGGMIRERGIAVLAVGGNIITAWSWFGTNMLGVGLHSYGFIDSAVFWMLMFVLSQLLFMAIGLTPWRQWRSFSKKPKPEPRTEPDPGPDAPTEPALV